MRRCTETMLRFALLFLAISVLCAARLEDSARMRMRLQADVEEAAALERREPLVNGSDDDDQMCVCALQNGAAAQMLGAFLALAVQRLLRRISQAEVG